MIMSHYIMNYVETNSRGDKFYYLNALLHRDNGPAIEWTDGTKEWYKNGKLHREDGPACEFAAGSKSWCKNGKLHREDGPAIEYANGGEEWWLNSKFYGVNNKFTNESWKFFVKTVIFS